MRRACFAVSLFVVASACVPAAGEETRVGSRRTFIFVLAIELPSSEPVVTVASADPDRVHSVWEMALGYPKGEHPSLVVRAGQYKAETQRALRWFARHCMLGEPIESITVISTVQSWSVPGQEVPGHKSP